MDNISEFSIIGAGVAGLTTAIALQNLGREFTLFERSKIIKGIGAGFGLAANAMHALDYIGIRQEVEEIGYYMDSFTILDQKGDILVNPNTKKISETYEQKNFAIHRIDLHQYLLSKVNPESVFAGKKALKFEQQQDYIEVFFEDGTIHKTKYLIIADGIKSPLRQQLIPDSKPRYAGYSCWRATIDNSKLKIQKGSETWGHKGRFGLSPMVNDRVYWYACINGPQQNPSFKNYQVQDLKNQFANYHSPIQEVLDNTEDSDLIWSDIIDIKPLKNFAFGNILIIGDAAHACTPNMGQGACQAMEDVAVLSKELMNNQPVHQAFETFEKKRLARTKYITDTSKFIGDVAQWENKFLISIRNKLMKIMPDSMNQKSLLKVFKEDFMK